LAVPVAINSKVADCIEIVPLARAMRWVLDLCPTSTMCAWPLASKWVNDALSTGGAIVAGLLIELDIVSKNVNNAPQHFGIGAERLSAIVYCLV